MTAKVTLSMEIELGWGRHHLSSPDRFRKLSDNRTAESDALSWFLEQCDLYNIPTSFDIVGHLLHESCDGYHPSPHPNSWWDDDPGSNVDEDPLFYAPDLVEDIRSSDAAHELCTHTYSHIMFDKVGRDIIDWELEKTNEAHQNYGIEIPTSIVPPAHKNVDNTILSENGLDVVRVPSNTIPDSKGSLFFWLFYRSNPVDDPKVRDGVLESYCDSYTSLTAPYLSDGCNDPHIAFQSIPKPIRTRWHTRYLLSSLERAIEKDSFVHFWTHLFNIGNDSQYKPIQALLKRIALEREEGNVIVCRMKDLPEITA